VDEIVSEKLFVRERAASMKYLKVWTSFREVLAPLSDDEVGRLFRQMLNYAETGETPDDFQGNERFIFPAAKQMIDLAAEKAETLRQNGTRGGRPKNQTKPNETKQNQTEPNETNENQTKAEKKRNEKKGNEKKRNETESSFIDDADAAEILREQDEVLTAAENAGFPRSEMVRAKLVSLFADHGREKMLAAIESCAEHSAVNIAYLSAVLKGTPKPDKTYNRDYSKDQDAAFDRLVKMGKKTDARDVHGYEQRDYSGAQTEAMRRMMEDEWGNDGKGATG
jgi:hypothetical protein